jgi:hypothetical protein
MNNWSKMNRKNKSLIMLTIILASTLATTMIPVMAKTNSLGIGPQIVQKNTLTSAKPPIQPSIAVKAVDQIQQQLEELDEEEAEKRLNDAINAPEIEDPESGVAPLWIARTYGKSWPILSLDSEEIVERIGTVFAATKSKVTEFGTVYDVIWGILGHKGERMNVIGKAVLCSDGIFVIKLEGNGVELYGIGIIRRAWYGVRLAMKGYLEHDEEIYGFQMSGKAHPIGFNWRPRLRRVNSIEP